MRFAHLSDCHLGSWRQPELQKLNLDSFIKAIDICLQENVDFILITGDLFDSAYPPIEILGKAFSHLKRLKDAEIPCYIIAGSHDYSASGKTFLSVLESAGFCKNIYNPEEKPTKLSQEGQIFLNPVLHENIALYGYPGKKSGMEVGEIKNIKLQESPGFFRIFALHTCIDDAVGNLPIDSIAKDELPEADYYALGHLHINYNKGKFVYAGPTCPNNFQEFEELGGGSFYIIETSSSFSLDVRKIEIKIKDIEVVNIQISNALTAKDKIIAELENRELKDKIVLLRLSGKLEQGKVSNINFKEIEDFVKSKGAYSLLKNISKIITEEPEINVEIDDVEKLEQEIINKYMQENKSKFNPMIFSLIDAFSTEKQEDETSANFNLRLFSEINKIIKIEDANQ